jgi:hypothetical protein
MTTKIKMSLVEMKNIFHIFIGSFYLQLNVINQLISMRMNVVSCSPDGILFSLQITNCTMSSLINTIIIINRTTQEKKQTLYFFASN